MAIYSFNQLRFAYGSHLVLQGLSGQISAGDFAALVGPNGAGKSTFLKVLAGLLRGYEGTVEFCERSLASYTSKELARKVAFVPQETHVVFPFTVDEIVMMGRLPYRPGFSFDTQLDWEHVQAAMAQTETLDLSGKAFNELSGGERQRIILASALAQDPEVLLLDEPTVYLDLKHQIHFYSILERLNAERNMTVVSVTHDVNLAARYARRMIALHHGQFVADGRPRDVLTPEYLYEIFGVAAAVLERPDGRGNYVIPIG